MYNDESSSLGIQFRKLSATAPASPKAPTVGALPPAFPTGMWGMQILHKTMDGL
jgi:hypothetical protein